MTLPSILERIAQHKHQEVAAAKKKCSWQTLAQAPYQPQSFVKALEMAPKPAIIAEIKKASPSKGVIRPDFNVPEIAQSYARHGAACLSILTDQHFFQGHPDYLKAAHQVCTLPLLRKDFIVDSYQIYESLALEADCILLIAALLDDYQLQDFCQLAQELNLSVLVESHTQEELLRALRLPTPLIGINNRSLHTFEVDLENCIRLRQEIPEDRIVICESGIYSAADIETVQAQGIHTFLIGESLMKEEDPGAALDKLRTAHPSST